MGGGCVCGNVADNIRPCHTCFAYYFEQAKSLRMISHGGFEFLFYLLYLVAGDEERVLGNFHHRGIVDGIGIEIVDFRIGIHLLEPLDLSDAEAEVGYVRVAVSARADIILDVEPVHDIVEQTLGARGDYYIVILPLAEIERLYLVDIRIPDLGDERVDHAAVFAVDAADAALFLQLLQRPVHRLVADHHGRIGHIHLEGGDARGVHVVDLAGDVLVPVVDRRVEAVVAPGAPVGLLVPELQAVGERLALVGAGEIDDRGRSAVDGGETAAVKVVDGGRVRDVEVKVRMRVDNAGLKELARHVDGLRQRVGDAARDADDLLPVDEGLNI